MKEKRVLAMFITSAVTLVASLAVTFGVLMTLADPVVATGVTRYQFAFNYTNNSLISVDGNTLKLKEDIIFQPASSVIWSEEEGKQALWFNGSNIEDDIVYGDESISTKIKVIPFRVTNKFAQGIQAKIKVSYDKESSALAKFTYVKLYDYKTATFVDYTDAQTIDLAADTFADYAVVICVDDTYNFSVADQINWGTDWVAFNVEVENITVIE